MGEFVTESFKSGILKDTGGLKPTSEGFRVRSSKNQLKVEATSTNSAATLRVFNATPGSVRINGLPPVVGTMSNAGAGKFVGQFVAGGPFNSVAVQSSQGGLKTAPVAQK